MQTRLILHTAYSPYAEYILCRRKLHLPLVNMDGYVLQRTSNYLVYPSLTSLYLVKRTMGRVDGTCCRTRSAASGGTAGRLFMRLRLSWRPLRWATRCRHLHTSGARPALSSEEHSLLMPPLR